MHYVVITDSSFLSDLLNDGDIWQCNLVTAKWVVDHNYGFYSDSQGAPMSPPWAVKAPVPESGIIQAATPDLIELKFSGDVLTDGSVADFTVEVNLVPVTVNAVSSTGPTLSITLAAPVGAGDGVIVHYDDVNGSLTSNGTPPDPVVSFTQDVVNDVAVVATKSPASKQPEQSDGSC